MSSTRSASCYRLDVGDSLRASEQALAGKGLVMFTIFGGKSAYCDGVSRRSFLQIGALGFGGLTLADLFRAEAQAGTKATGKAIITIFLGGGPSHMDMFDLKPE